MIPSSANDNKARVPDISPTYLAMAAAQMHTEGRFPSDAEVEAGMRTPQPKAPAK